MFVPGSTFALLGLVAAVRAGGLPECYIDPYASALNTTTCGPLDVGCVCQSNTYLSALQDDVPQACDTTDQAPIFSYIMAACSDFGVLITLSTTSVSLMTSTISTATVTRTFSTTIRTTGTQVAGATGIADSITSDCPKTGLSSGASVGIIIAAFALGGLLFAVGAVLILRRRQTKAIPESTPYTDVPNTPYTAYTAYSSQSSQVREKPQPTVEAASKRPRVEMMDSDRAGSHGRPAELS